MRQNEGSLVLYKGREDMEWYTPFPITGLTQWLALGDVRAGG
jgi:hypothetical protein